MSRTVVSSGRALLEAAATDPGRAARVADIHAGLGLGGGRTDTLDIERAPAVEHLRGVRDVLKFQGARRRYDWASNQCRSLPDTWLPRL